MSRVQNLCIRLKESRKIFSNLIHAQKAREHSICSFVGSFSMRKLGHWKSATLRRGIEQWLDGPNSTEPQALAFLSCHKIYFILLLPGVNVMISHATGVTRRHSPWDALPSPHISYRPYPKSGLYMASKGESKAFLYTEITYTGKVMAVPSYVRARNQNVCVDFDRESWT